MDSKKTQKVVVIILVITALLGIGGAFLVYHISVQDETTRVIEREDKQYCACITAYTTPDCNTCDCTRIESQTLESRIGEIIDDVCILDCEPSEQEEESVKEIIKCLIPQVGESNCHSVSVKDSDTRDLIIPPIPTDRPVTISANFVPREISGEEENFNRYTFIINGITTEVSNQDVPSTVINGQKTYIPEIEFDNFQNIDTLTIQAIGYSDKDFDGQSSGRYCYRQYDLTQYRSALCSNLTARTEAGATPQIVNVSRLELNTPNIDKEKGISIEFSFNHEDLPTIRTTTLPSDLLEEIIINDTIFLEGTLLYSTPEFFTNAESFPTFNFDNLGTRNVLIRAQVYMDNSPIDSSLCRENISIIMTGEEVEEEWEEEWEEEDRREREETRREEEEEERDEDSEEPIAIGPEIQVVMEGPSCVRKAESADETSRTNYRIIIVNNSENQETIRHITNKLPLGFKYVEGTTTINGALVNDDILDITSIGESQELIWSNNWSLQADSHLILEYGVNVTHNAIDGENQNEAIATPTNVPENMDNLRAEFVTLVSDECEHEEELPETGNFTYISLLVGIAAFIFGILIYQGQIEFLNRIMLKIVSSKAIKKHLMTPQEYLEDNILEEDETD